MKCPSCGFVESKVIDSRSADDNERIRRRRECLRCGKRFTTNETIEKVHVIVVKRDKSRESFDRNKLTNGLLRACEKRPVSLEQIEDIVNKIESKVQSSLDREITTQQIGELAMDQLKDIDEVSYVRFASVYRQFKDINTFMDELNKLFFFFFNPRKFALNWDILQHLYNKISVKIFFPVKTTACTENIASIFDLSCSFILTKTLGLYILISLILKNGESICVEL